MKKRFGCRTFLVALMVLALSMGVFGCGKADKAQQGNPGADLSANVEEYHADGTESVKDDAPDDEKESTGTEAEIEKESTESEPDDEKESAGTELETEKDSSGDTSDTEEDTASENKSDYEIDAESDDISEAEPEITSDIALDTQSESVTKNSWGEASEEASDEYDQNEGLPIPDEDGVYTSKEDVALYIHVYGKLPSNFITKKQAKKLGWTGGSLEDYAPGKSIGGDYFGNYEGLLPKDQEYYECDIDTLGKKKRGAKRIIYSDDGHIYYTDDHYESFELLYGP